MPQQHPRLLRRGRSNIGAQIFRAVQLLFAVAILAWIGTALYFIRRKDDGGGPKGLRHAATAADEHWVALDLDLDPQRTITIRISTFPNERCPKAYEFLSWMIENQQTQCRPCTIYRGEPVPSYWGSNDYPDRWDNGGRWGPPYALVQGGFVNSKVKHVERENHRPQIERGMVAWAGLQGIHFFIALADHPEWGHEHTVWGRVFDDDMHLVDGLVKDRPLKVLEHNVPVVTNFVDPMPFRIRGGKDFQSMPSTEAMK